MRVLSGLLLLGGIARADSMMSMPMGAAPRPFHATMSLVAAGFDDPFFASGDYQGAIASGGWQHGAFDVHALCGLYRLDENGATFYGPGDVTLGADWTWSRGALALTPMIMASVPTGNEMQGLGMGHVMAMPSVMGMWSGGRFGAALTIGFDRAVVSSLEGHDHGPMPLVEPMNMSELAGEARGDVAIGPVRATARVAGAVPVGMPAGYRQASRAIAAVGARWSHDRIDADGEVQIGLAGDPFTVRGLVETAVHF